MLHGVCGVSDKWMWLKWKKIYDGRNNRILLTRSRMLRVELTWARELDKFSSGIFGKDFLRHIVHTKWNMCAWWMRVCVYFLCHRRHTLYTMQQFHSRRYRCILQSHGCVCVCCCEPKVFALFVNFINFNFVWRFWRHRLFQLVCFDGKQFYGWIRYHSPFGSLSVLMCLLFAFYMKLRRIRRDEFLLEKTLYDSLIIAHNWTV